MGPPPGEPGGPMGPPPGEPGGPMGTRWTNGTSRKDMDGPDQWDPPPGEWDQADQVDMGPGDQMGPPPGDQWRGDLLQVNRDQDRIHYLVKVDQLVDHLR